jgi:membrane-associated protein
MELIEQLIDYVLHIDKYLTQIVSKYHHMTYLILALIVFCETGLVVTPFLPGDSLLFAAGALAANEANELNVVLIIIILILAALAGDNTNYFIGKGLAKKEVGAKLFGIFTVKQEYLDKTHAFYEKHGARTIILARFVPIVRTFAPFVAGVGSMTYRKYITYCIAGAVLWVTSLTMAGYAFGNIPWVKTNFEFVVLGIIFLSLIPVFIGIIKARIAAKKTAG